MKLSLNFLRYVRFGRTDRLKRQLEDVTKHVKQLNYDVEFWKEWDEEHRRLWMATDDKLQATNKRLEQLAAYDQPDPPREGHNS